MKGYKREDRVGELLLEEISSIVFRDIKDPRVDDVTITHVRVTSDLQHAVVYFITNHEKENEVKKGLVHSAGFIRYELKKRLRLRIIPDLTFEYDDSYDYGERIDRIIRELKSKQDE